MIPRIDVVAFKKLGFRTKFWTEDFHKKLLQRKLRVVLFALRFSRGFWKRIVKPVLSEK